MKTPPSNPTPRALVYGRAKAYVVGLPDAGTLTINEAIVASGFKRSSLAMAARSLGVTFKRERAKPQPPTSR